MNLGKFIILVLTGAIIYAGCDDTITQDDIDKKVIPDQNVSFGQHILPVLLVKCAYSGCHSNEDAKQGLVLTSHGSVTSDFRIVNPYTPESSSLVTYEHSGFILQTPFTLNQLNGVKTWIKEGAKNN